MLAIRGLAKHDTTPVKTLGGLLQPTTFTVSLRIGPFLRTAVITALLTVLVASAACSPAVDVGTALRLESASTGWVQVNRNKVVPALSFKLRNTSDQRLRVVLVNARFHSADDVEEWGTGFLTAAGSDGLMPGATTATIVLKGEFGYTGIGVQQMVGQFVETKVDLFAKYGAERWAPLGGFTIDRQLLQ